MADGAVQAGPAAGPEKGRGILVLCTANVCRSPMAAALLRERLGRAGRTVTVTSAGLLPGGSPALPEVLAVMSGYGIDLSGHVSRTVCERDLAAADLVLAVSREHLRHAVVTAPGSWPRAFTMKELARRAGPGGTRQANETLAAWLARAHEGRDRRGLLGASPDDDVADPAGGPPESYADTARLLDRLTSRLAALGWSAPAE